MLLVWQLHWNRGRDNSASPTRLPTPSGKDDSFLYLLNCQISVYFFAAGVTLCPAYSTTNTNNAVQNYATCTFYACSGFYTISTCPGNGGSGTGDPYLRLYLNGVQLTYNDDTGGTCGLGSTMTYQISTCGT